MTGPLGAAEQEIRDLEHAIRTYPAINPRTNPLPGMLEDARARAAGLRGAGARPPGISVAIATTIVDALLAIPGVVVPPGVADLLTDAIAAALLFARTS